MRAYVGSFLSVGANVPFQVFQTLEGATAGWDGAGVRLLRIGRQLNGRTSSATDDVGSLHETRSIQSDTHLTRHHEAVLVLQNGQGSGGRRTAYGDGHGG